ncbi:MAG: hypothetical protein NE330_15465, partial [Lentisphaeraceae bacterium]|nr:hypothetical protein [Lentisphaeraceae bacterium]
VIHIATVSTILVLTGLYITKKTDVVSPQVSMAQAVDIEESKLKVNSLKQKLTEQTDELTSLIQKLASSEAKVVELTDKLNASQKTSIIKFPVRPNVQNLHKNFFQASDKILISHYGNIIQKLNFNDEDKKTFIELIKNYQAAHTKQLLAKMKAQGKNVVVFTNHQDIMAGTKEENDLKKFLGDNFNLFEYNRKSKFDRTQVNKLNGKCSSKNKLNFEQKEQLVELLHKRSNDKKKKLEISDEVYFAEAEKFLNEEQLRVLKKQVKSETKSITININGEKKVIHLRNNAIITPK